MQHCMVDSHFKGGPTPTFVSHTKKKARKKSVNEPHCAVLCAQKTGRVVGLLPPGVCRCMEGHTKEV